MRYINATLIGATGLIGNQLFDLLQDDSAFSEIKILVRRPIKIDNPKVKVSIMDFNDNLHNDVILRKQPYETTFDYRYYWKITKRGRKTSSNSSGSFKGDP